MQIILVLLDQGIIANSLYVVHLELAIVFISLVPRPVLKLSIFFPPYRQTWGISGQIVEVMHVLSKGLGPLCELHELGGFHAH